MAPQRISSDALVGHVADLVDQTLVSYAEWREDANSVADAYGRWAAATRETQRFFAYMAALDQEESAARSLAETVQRLDRWTQSSRC